MAYAFRLKAKRDIHFLNSGDIALAKGMTIEHIENSSNAPCSGNVAKTFKQRFGREVCIMSMSDAFEITKL